MIDNSRGILAMSASVVAFVFNDAMVKLAAETMPAVQAIGVRGIFATLWCGLALLLTGSWRRLSGAVHPKVVQRALLEATASFLFFIALFHIPFAIATAVNLSTPLIVTVLAVLILKENVRWRRWSAVIMGFVGVLLVIQPRPGDINAWTWMVLLASVAGAARDVLSRFLPASLPTLVVSFTTAIVVATGGCAWALIEGWQPMTGSALGLLLVSSLLLALAYQLVILALRSRAGFSVMASFRYASILWALAIGYVVWGDVPNALALFGIAMIVGAGLYILQRERLRR